MATSTYAFVAPQPNPRPPPPDTCCKGDVFVAAARIGVRGAEPSWGCARVCSRAMSAAGQQALAVE